MLEEYGEKWYMYPTINMKATGIHLRQIMEQRELSVKDVKQYLNLSSVQSIYHWLNGKSLPTIDNLYALSELFRLPVDELIVGNRTYMPFSEKPMIRHEVRTFDSPFASRMWAYYHMIKRNIA